MPGAFITFDGEPIPGRVPPRLIVRDNPMINDQHNAVKHLYQEFARHNGLSLAGYHVSEARLPDGTRVRMESNNGVDRVTVWPDRRSSFEGFFDIRPLAFFASLDAPLGVAPTEEGGNPVAVKSLNLLNRPVSRWDNPPLIADQFNQYAMAFSHHVRTGYGASYEAAGNALPGNVDWYDPRLDSPHYGLVLSWWNYFSGRYQSFDQPVDFQLSNNFFNDCRALGPAAVSSRKRDDAIYDFRSAARLVWCNGVPIAGISGYVVGACLHQARSGTRLRVLGYLPEAGEIRVYEGGINVDSGIGIGQDMVRMIAKIQTITLPMTKKEKRSVLLHPAHCNASGTRAVIVQTPKDDSDYIESGVYLREIDLDTATVHDVELPWTQNIQEDQPEVGIAIHEDVETSSPSNVEENIPPHSRAYDRTGTLQVTRNINASLVTSVLVCADYRLDTLEYIYTEDMRRIWDDHSFSGASSIVKGPDGAYYGYMGRPHQFFSYTSALSSSSQGAQGIDGSFRIMHSELGELGACEYGVDINMSYSGRTNQNGQYNKLSYPMMGQATTQSDSQSNRFDNYSWKGVGAREIQHAGVVGDMRVRALSAYIAFEDGAACMGSFSTHNRSESFTSETAKQNPYSNWVYSLNQTASSSSSITVDPGPQFARTPLTVRRLELSGFMQVPGLASAVISLGSELDINDNEQVTSENQEGFLDDKFQTVTAGFMRMYPQFSSFLNSEFTTDSTEISNTVQHVHYRLRIKDPGVPRNRLIGVFDLGITSSFDGQLYYQSMGNWPSDSPYDTDTKQPVDATLLTFEAKIYNAKTGKELVDLNADPNLNPSPGVGKTCTTMLFLGPVRDPAGRYTDRPMYLMKPEQD